MSILAYLAFESDAILVKVKCDEKSPVCGACSRHGVPCTYPDLVRSSRLPSSKISALPSPPDDTTLSAHETEGRRLLELRLLHCYLTDVVRSLYSDDPNDPVKNVWSSMVPTLAFRHPFLLHALLSTAALYLSVTTHESSSCICTGAKGTDESAIGNDKLSNASSNSAAHQYYLNLALQKQREAIAHLTPENVDAATFATLLIANQCFLLTDSLEREPYTPPYRWMLLASATPTVVVTAADMVGPNSPVKALIKGYEFLSPPLTVERAENRESFQNLLHWEHYPEPEFSRQVQEAYEEALNYLGSILIAIQNNEDQSRLCRRLLGFAPLAPKLFLEFLEKKRPRALVILAHLFAMTQVVDHVWWFRGAGKRHVHGIQSIVPDDWQWAMDWPLDFLASRNP